MTVVNTTAVSVKSCGYTRKEIGAFVINKVSWGEIAVVYGLPLNDTHIVQ